MLTRYVACSLDLDSTRPRVSISGSGWTVVWPGEASANDADLLALFLACNEPQLPASDLSGVLIAGAEIDVPVVRRDSTTVVELSERFSREVACRGDHHHQIILSPDQFRPRPVNAFQCFQNLLFLKIALVIDGVSYGPVL